MCNKKKNKCLGCLKLDLMYLFDNEKDKEKIRSYFESESVGG